MEVAGKLYLGLGSNLGDSKLLLSKAIKLISEKIGTIVRVSKVYVSAALNPENNPEMSQPDYFNMVLSCICFYEPEQVLKKIQSIEEELGLDRKNKIYWGPRIIDIDILAFDNLILKSDTLIIPHPEFEKRDFVLYPLQEISPDFQHPANRRKISDMISRLKNTFIKDSFSLPFN